MGAGVGGGTSRFGLGAGAGAAEWISGVEVGIFGVMWGAWLVID